MLPKPGFTRSLKHERTLAEIVSEGGTLRRRDILFVIRQLCLRLERTADDPERRGNPRIHPRNVIVAANGEIRFADRDLPLAVMEAWLPPELDRSDPCPPGSEVYALGMLMLYMATGKEHKTDAEAFVRNRSLLSLIEGCTAFDPGERFRDCTEVLEAVRQAEGRGRLLLKWLFALLALGLLAGLVYHGWREGSRRGALAGERPGFISGYASGYEQGLADAPGLDIGGAPFDAANGNLPGNLATVGGPFAACSETAVFVLLEGEIQQMDPYTKTAEILKTGAEAADLHYYEGWLYYSTAEAVCRLNPGTGREEVFCDRQTGKLHISGRQFYLHDDDETGYLYRINPEDRSLTQLNGALECRCLNIVGEKLFYIAPDRGNSIYSCDLDGGSSRLISGSSYDSLCVHAGKLYAAGGNGLIRMDLDGADPERLSTLPASCPNVTDGGVFYVSGRGRSLEWLSPDGRTGYTVVPTATGSFNVAGQWIFYHNDDDGGRLWRVRVNGSDAARVTTAAAD